MQVYYITVRYDLFITYLFSHWNSVKGGPYICLNKSISCSSVVVTDSTANLIFHQNTPVLYEHMQSYTIITKQSFTRRHNYRTSKKADSQETAIYD